MGGFGSGRNWSSHATTDDYVRMDVSYMAREGLLRDGVARNLTWSSRGREIASISFRTEADRIVLRYRHQQQGKDWESLEYAVYLERTPCHYGGSRTWFLCPARGCGRRTAFLYGGRIYACRRCYRLVYQSQRQTQCDRATDRAWNLLKRLKADHYMTIFDPEPIRPKGMHQKTFLRLSQQYEATRLLALSNAPGGMSPDWF